MNERQEFALLNPINRGATEAETMLRPMAVAARSAAYRDVRRDRRSGLLLMSILAVDR